MQEKQIQKKIIDYLKSIGAYVIKTVVTSRSGVPDIIACYRGVFLAFEVKKEDGVVSKLQEYNIQEIKKAGGTCAVVRSLDEVKRIIAIQ